MLTPPPCPNIRKWARFTSLLPLFTVHGVGDSGIQCGEDIMDVLGRYVFCWPLVP